VSKSIKYESGRDGVWVDEPFGYYWHLKRAGVDANMFATSRLPLLQKSSNLLGRPVRVCFDYAYSGAVGLINKGV
jgi:hypothetical protein